MLESKRTGLDIILYQLPSLNVTINHIIYMWVSIYMCIYTHIFTQTGTKLNHCFFPKGLYSKIKKLNSVQLELILQLREYVSDFSTFYQKRKTAWKVILQPKLTASLINLKLLLLVCRNHNEEQIFLRYFYIWTLFPLPAFNNSCFYSSLF